MRPAGVGSNGLTADDPDFREMERDGPAHLWHAQAALLHNSGRVTDRSQSCLNAIEFALTQACPGLTYDSVPHI